MKTRILVFVSSLLVFVAGQGFATGHGGIFARGKALYEKNCARCHGAAGMGTDKGPPFINKIYRPSHYSDLTFQMAALNGVRAHHWNFDNMPPIDGVSMAEVGMITQYIRAIQRDAGVY